VLGVGIETMRFGDGDARMRWTWILKLAVVMGLTELRKLECRCKSGLVAGRLRTPRPTRLQPNQIEEPMKIAPALGIGGTIAESGFPSAGHIVSITSNS
jgi:hypothetical protein